MVTLVQHLRRYFVLASYATVNLCTSQSVSGKQEALARTRFIPLLRRCYWLVDSHYLRCCEIIKQLIQTFNIRPMIHKRPTMYDPEPGCITGRYFLTSVQLSHVMTLAYITLTLKIGNKI